MEKKYGIGIFKDSSFKYPTLKIFFGLKFYVFVFIKGVGFHKFTYITRTERQKSIIKENKLDEVDFGLFFLYNKKN